MRSHFVKFSLETAIRVTVVLLLGASLSVAQVTVNLTATPQHAILPDGQSIPMWGLVCTPDPTTGAVGPCTSLHFNSTTGAYDLQAGGDIWQPPLIIVPSGQNLQINLTNNLTFTPTGTTTANNIPTSLVIVGQLGGGLGTQRTTTPSPDHSQAQATTWPIAGGVGATPPAQAPRVQSLATEVAVGTPAALTWTNPRPGTYLIESGTHPSIQGPMGLYGVLVVTAAPVSGAAGTAYGTAGTASAVSYNADVPLLFSEIDPRQNIAVDAAVHTAGFSETAVWSGQSGKCGDPQSTIFNTCYPPAVNYTPLYYLINGIAFDKTHASTSLFAASPNSGVTGNILVRLVNAGLRMHVPSIVGSQIGTAVAPALPPSGFSLIAEDGNPLPGVPRVQSEVFMAAGKTYDVMINAPAAGLSALPVYDRELSLSGGAINRDAGMLAYIGINGSTLPTTGVFAATTSQAKADSYYLVTGNTLAVSDVAKGVLANDINVFGAKVQTAPTGGVLTLNLNGTFTYIPNLGTTSDSFTYCGNGATSGTACAQVTLAQCTTANSCLEAGAGIHLVNDSFTSNVAKLLSIKSPGVLANDYDDAGYPLTAVLASAPASLGLSLNADGSFTAQPTGAGNVACVTGTPLGSQCFTFSYTAKNSQGTPSTNAATVTLTFLAGSGLAVTVLDGNDKTTQISDYRWIIEEDKTFYINPNCTDTSTTPPPGCPTNTATGGVPQTFGVNFHTSYMPLVAQGCTGPNACESGQTIVDENPLSPTFGQHLPAVCDVGNGVCRPDPSRQGKTQTFPRDVHLDPTKRYYISVLPGDAANPFSGGPVGHTMGGAPITFNQTSVTVLTEPTPLQPAQLSVFVFEDDNPLNGEHDAGGGIDVLAPNEPGLGGFEIILADDAGGTGDSTGQPTYDMFNMPLTNSLSGQIDPATGMDACPIAQQATTNAAQKGIVGMIVTCPTYEADGLTLSPLAGQAVVNNLYPGRYGIIANPAADRIARGEEWLQTNTLDGQKAHDAFLRVGEPNYFQEFGPAGYHVSIGFANPAIINGRLPEICAATSCNNEVKGKITTTRMSRIPDERLYSSGSRDSFSFTQCYVSIGDTDGADFAIQKCDPDGNFDIKGLPAGTWRVAPFDQWNDQLVDGLSVPVALSGGNVVDMGDVPVQQWQANIYTQTFFDQNGNGIRDNDEPGLTLVPTNIRFRDGSYSNLNNTDLAGNAGFNEVFPLFNWYVIETDSTRYKNTGTHVVYDSGGPADGGPINAAATCSSGTNPACGNSSIGANLANTYEANPLPSSLSVPGAVYCDTADCTGFSIANGPVPSGPNKHSTGRIDPPWVVSEGWQGFSGQNSFLNFGKKPFAVGENGGIHGHVIYASTRPFDDPQLLLQLTWEPMVPHVIVNLYQEGTAQDGTQSLKLIDTTQTSSWDDWAQGFRSDNVPNMNCPGQSTSDLFFFSLFNQTNYLNPGTALPNNSQFKCYDGMHNWNQLQPAPYDGMYSFPSVTGINPVTGKPTGTNCTACIPNPDSTDPYRVGTPMLPPGKYVVEIIVPQGYELVKEEDKNILIGDNYIAPVTQQFGGLGSIFILPDQAAITETYNKFNAQNSTNDLGVQPRHEGDTGSVETFWPCVGAARIVPDYISLFPQSQEVSPFAGASRNLCDRKEITLEDQSSALAKFYIFTSTHVAAHFTGVITDDFTSEFDPFSPAFGEKFAPPNLPISVKDFAGNEIARTVSDHWGAFNGLNFSTWEVNPPNPTGYAPTVMVYCMNDPGSGPTPDPLYNPSYSQFCYETPFMPGQTQYLDTPVIPTSAFSEGYNHADCAYPDTTPAISSVTSADAAGPWVSAAGHTITINALGDQNVDNYGYSGPSATTTPFNLKKVKRHFGFGSTAGTVTIGGINAPLASGTSWSDTSLTVVVPSGVPQCPVQQQGQTTAYCGQLVITTTAGKQSVDTVNVTIGGKAPTVLAAGQTIQSAIDAATPGDMIIIPAGTYNELLLMWKPVRLQGVGASSTVINANTHPAGKLDPWRRQVNCLFGLALNGQPSTGNVSIDPITNQVVPGTGGINPYDPSGTYACLYGSPNNPQVDRIPLEGILGWDASVNGNLAEQLQEPTLMGAYEGAAITVLAKGVRYPAGSTQIFGNGADTGGIATESQMPLGTVLLTDGVHPTGDSCDANGNLLPAGRPGFFCSNTSAPNPNAKDCTDYPSNFLCNPSRIDGLSITNSSQGGGGIFVHGWGHKLQITNNRILNNTGSLSGGINVGQGETPDLLVVGNNGNPPGFDQAPGTCQATNSLPANLGVPYCYNTYVNVHNNAIVDNSSIGDELFSGTPAGAGGVTFTAGSDWYSFQQNWVCGNLSSGDGGGFAHLGFTWNGDIEHNTIIFNQSTNPTIPTNGGGIAILGAAPDGQNPAAGGTAIECGSITDIDCAPGLSDGTGPNLVINANLIQGNGAESGSGGGIRLQTVNGSEIANFATPTLVPLDLTPWQWWNSVKVTNNIIANNVAGWDGGGISLQDALKVDIVNNTIVSNDATASSGVLFNTDGAPNASTPPPGCNPQTGVGCTNPVTTSTPQVGGLVTMENTPNLVASLPATVWCP
ncbi:MAG TPA: hypothetical protein VG498_08530, partial [Terriglobales bacterium]|nr:hypothetical protein [Terriglobales bacterium]